MITLYQKLGFIAVVYLLVKKVRYRYHILAGMAGLTIAFNVFLQYTYSLSNYDLMLETLIADNRDDLVRDINNGEFSKIKKDEFAREFKAVKVININTKHPMYNIVNFHIKYQFVYDDDSLVWFNCVVNRVNSFWFSAFTTGPRDVASSFAYRRK